MPKKERNFFYASTASYEKDNNNVNSMEYIFISHTINSLKAMGFSICLIDSLIKARCITATTLIVHDIKSLKTFLLTPKEKGILEVPVTEIWNVHNIHLIYAYDSKAIRFLFN